MSAPSHGFRPSGVIEFETFDPVAVADTPPPAPVVAVVDSQTLEFEALTPEAAAEPQAAEQAAAADDGIDRDPLSINFGRKKDTKPVSAERMLNGPAIDWFVAFGAQGRPKALCDQYPHVANRLAALWSDRARAVQALEQLVADPRWGSTGYPGLVQRELQTLLARLGAA